MQLNLDIQQLQKDVEALKSLPGSQLWSTQGLELQWRVHTQLRKLSMCFPNSSLPHGKRQSYIEQRLGADVSREVLDAILHMDERKYAKPADLESIEEKQNYRCATCGKRFLDAKTHVDHIIPLAFGGTNDACNLQILCTQCNLGKGSAIHWLALCRFFGRSRDERLSESLRYAVLASGNGRCSVEGCPHNARTSELHTTLKVPYSEGGRYIFDNLQVVCEMHKARFDEEQRRERERSLANVTSRAAGHRFQLRSTRH